MLFFLAFLFVFFLSSFSYYFILHLRQSFDFVLQMWNKFIIFIIIFISKTSFLVALSISRILSNFEILLVDSVDHLELLNLDRFPLFLTIFIFNNVYNFQKIDKRTPKIIHIQFCTALAKIMLLIHWKNIKEFTCQS